MPAFDDRSRYRDAEIYQVPDHRGRIVNVAAPPELPAAPIAGVHQLRAGQRLDHLAAGYCKDPTGFWRIAAANAAMHPDWLAEQAEIDIPGQGSGGSLGQGA
jgi:hypothetical protein